jgi:hypothetical protein
MGALSKVLRSLEGGCVAFRCPGCDEMHMIRVDAAHGPSWTWNGDAERPTFSPSVLVRGYKMSEEGMAMWMRDEPPPGDRYPGQDTVCHSFVTDGQIAFLSDCTHALAGQTVPIPPHTKEPPCDA